MSETRRYEEAIKWVRSNAAEELINRAGPARLIRLIIGSGAAGSCTVYDSASASGDVVAVASTAGPGVFEYDLVLFTGLTIDKSGSADITVIYE